MNTRTIDGQPRDLHLYPHVYCTRTNDGTILLDLKRERYFGIGISETRVVATSVRNFPASERALAGDNGESPAPQHHDVIERLISEHLLHSGRLPDAELAQRYAQHISVVNDIPFAELIEPAPTITSIHYIRICRAGLVARWRLRHQRLSAIAASVSQRRAVAGATGLDAGTAGHELARIYWRLRPWVLTAKNACLLDSLVLLEFFALFQLFPSWVLGVKTKPFRAHSWAQLNGTVLNDTLRHVGGYRPILTV